MNMNHSDDRRDQMDNETSDLSKARLRAWLQILKVSRKIEGELREKMRIEFGSTLPRFDVLAALYRERDGMRMSELSKSLMVSNGNVTGIVDRLVGEGMLVRVPVENDRRASIVRLTEAGEKDFAERALVHEGWVSELFSDLSASDADGLIRILRTISHHNEAPHD
ncbi:MarR family winged helix-turn-helix transcriptional regulator [Thalassospira lucentensis]|uniref:MarR family transcriptional regulator n=1 Tax=Thalassospira lucentensis TaxID=168935 RepID=A0A358HXN1_9PROT|nr:MarR family transcriptional regulator [Thalassospira lucentensis]RCK20737.1 MarR family transcriptional regulator [Thalassospira lucentensis MCCC 1A00383 = DSM 14000]HBU99933.1 MarR family transcriptional regulator [Thalassospira lucentensis]HCW67078.1 MarR family transcriptional regulator [Thalassospira lucentensis]|tara:strand:+ start:25220 stop:25717 length:498 start_codon:yes stop_codon:yes gene_type:complete